MKKDELNIMTSVKIIENLKAQLLCIVGEFFRLLTKGSNVTRNSILDCISGAISILYVLAEKLGYSFAEVDHVMKENLELGIRAEDEVEKEGKSLSKLKTYINNRKD
ncbi:MazG-like family protein [Clostridium botulinum]|uniref:MazG-like family protein n=1 Tax=Clostridium botulinum TaxID=1491 RepID=UPI001C9AA91E|nr:MazG-like family protein [Clostridium botulinum]MBY6811793.1 MazG-like family protein [Clostridium botulinum]MBY6825274.1 MazG-like family protein [Clostridium botulinum]MBY6835607.1 MazG-like family protein [Clostridium botulinum]MBY6974295.1 MazG-like family protein [Clostridium botulinum]MCS6105207.1 MazG-like family protein [Clostridium botulinum]